VYSCFNKICTQNPPLNIFFPFEPAEIFLDF